jgi:prepilin-type N-terminal cleavage/methylation domain-containing protein
MQITRARKAFTLTELVVTIVILGLLAAIAAISYSAFMTQATGEIADIDAAQTARLDNANSYFTGN